MGDGCLADIRAGPGLLVGITRVLEAEMTDVEIPRIRWPQAVEVHASRILIRWMRSSAAVSYSVGVPMAMVIIIKLMFSGMVAQFSGAPMNMVDVAIMVAVSQAFTGGLFGAGAIVQERHEGLLDRLATFPGPRHAAIIGRILAESVRAFMSMLVALTVGFLCGASFGGVMHVGAILVALAVVAVSAGAFGVMLGYMVGTPQGAFSFTPLIMAFTVFNTAMMPRDMYAPALRPAVDVSPVTVVSQLVDTILFDQISVSHVAVFLCWFGGIAALSVLVLIRRVKGARR
jgi:ABC drug efflux pump, inner membrane subunit, drrB family